MAEAFATDTTKSLLRKLGSSAVRSAWGLEADLSSLEERLSAINTVLSDAEKIQSKNDSIRLWLHDLIEVLYDAEDALDEIECETLRRKVVKTTGSTSRKVRRFFSSSSMIAFRLRMGHKIKNIMERLAEISSLKSNFNLNEQTNDGSHVLHEEKEILYRSFESFSGLIGRDDEKERIINILVEPFRDGDAHPFVLPMVGMGGLGKTALAKSVYDDETVNNHFELKMVACVSDGFAFKKVTQKIIKSATGETCVDLDEGELNRKLETILNGRKYLLVLDDLWNEDAQQWLLLKPLLSKGAFGSKILVTTRSEHVAVIVGTVAAHNLSLLGQEHCLSLFYSCAFKERQGELYPHLVQIGNDIVEKCKQIPLAVINLGTQLCGKIDDQEWKTVRDSEKWEEKEDGILPALKISYQLLPNHLKRCFLYCSIFPKDYQFIDLILVQFWMAHGLIKSSNPNENLEDVGLRYVHELILKCFFQDYVGLTFSASFKMHDLMHDLASSLARNECSIISSQNHQISKTSRHLSVLDSNSLFDQTLPKYPHKLHHVRSIVFATSLEGLGCKAGFEKCLSEFKHLRSLELMDDSEFEAFPERVGALKNLRYLNFAGNAKMKRLPKSIFKLQSLQAMVVGVGLEELPKDVRYMISLGFLFLVTKQKRLPEGGIGCLECLQTLVISYCENLENLCEDMQGLKSLQKLYICGCKSLISLPGSMKCLTALKELFIGDCEKLDMMTLDEEKERETQRLSLQIVAFGGLPATQALPKQLLHGCTNSLERFMIVDCPNIIELPECISNLKKLQNLQIVRCPRLRKRCQRETGEDWPKISHIPEIYVESDDSSEETSD
uniref:Rx N-terminal domain-containing protein n=1 Tax=Salix viminalis TaxID=40686 RepID=A0A6N2L5Z4_SALVM